MAGIQEVWRTVLRVSYVCVSALGCGDDGVCPVLVYEREANRSEGMDSKMLARRENVCMRWLNRTDK